MADPKPSNGPRIGAVVITSNCPERPITHEVLEQRVHAPFDGLGIGPAESVLELGAPLELSSPHPPLAAKRAIGMKEKIPRLDIHGDVVMKRKELAPLETLKPIDGNGVQRRYPPQLPRLKQKTVTSEPRNVMAYGTVATREGTSDLSVRHTAHDHGKDVTPELWALLPVACRERLYTKVTITD